MKIVALLMLSLSTAMDPGCGAAVGSNTAKGPGQGGAGGGGDAGGTVGATDCGALGSHTFCEDFASALPGRFDAESTSAGTLGLGAGQTNDPSSALTASLLHVTTSTRTFARLHKDFVIRGSHFVLAFAERVDPGCVGQADLVQTGTLSANGNKYFLAVGHGSDGDSIVETSLDAGVYVQSHKVTGHIPRGAWTRVVLDADLTKRTVDLSVDGSPIVQGEPLKYAPPDASQLPSVDVGVLTDNITFNPSACTAEIDDVTFDVHL